MYFLGDTIKTPQKFCLFLYEKSNRVNTIDPPVTDTISGLFIGMHFINENKQDHLLDNEEFL
jgi:hypothetical protein